MIDKLVNVIFKWDTLRSAIFSEVNLYNSISRTLNDPEEMKTSSAMWCEDDGWRGWYIKEDGNYCFHDIPEKGIEDIFEIIFERN